MKKPRPARGNSKRAVIHSRPAKHPVVSKAQLNLPFTSVVIVQNTRVAWVSKRNGTEVTQLLKIYSRLPNTWLKFNRLPAIRSERQLKNMPAHFFQISDDSGTVVGACSMRLNPNKRTALISHIFILPSFQRAGHGRGLMLGLFKMAKQAGMEKAYGYVSALDAPMPKAELRMMLSLGCKQVSAKPMQFRTGLFWQIEKDLRDAVD